MDVEAKEKILFSCFLSVLYYLHLTNNLFREPLFLPKYFLHNKLLQTSKVVSAKKALVGLKGIKFYEE